ncbi:MAG: hypothetical protein RIS64_4113 [Bacteroidota bacterium]|jgi:Helix-turn-helix of DDE superfamily endonuclease
MLDIGFGHYAIIITRVIRLNVGIIVPIPSRFAFVYAIREGLYRHLFEEMLACVHAAKLRERKHPTKGVEPALSVEDQLLITVMYWREYRSQGHLAVDFEVHQSTVSRTIRAIETILIQSRRFSLPGRKSLRTSDGTYEVVVMDVTETPTERPKKNKSANTAAKRSDTP